jgi:hypothetical protein
MDDEIDDVPELPPLHVPRGQGTYQFSYLMIITHSLAYSTLGIPIANLENSFIIIGSDRFIFLGSMLPCN